MKYYFLILIFSLTLVSCSSSYEQYYDGTPKTSASLTGTKWVLKTLNDQKIFTPEGGKEIYFILTTEFSKADGNGGCNNFSAKYNVMGSKMFFEDIVATEMSCERMDTESAFFKALGNTLKYKIKDNDLFLYDTEKVIAKLTAEQLN